MGVWGYIPSNSDFGAVRLPERSLYTQHANAYSRQTGKQSSPSSFAFSLSLCQLLHPLVEDAFYDCVNLNLKVCACACGEDICALSAFYARITDRVKISHTTFREHRDSKISSYPV